MTREKNIDKKNSKNPQKQFIKHKLDINLLEQIFAPSVPSSWNSNPNEWLNSLDILKVMKQYEREYPEFDFIGPTPIDWNHHKVNGKCVWEELCKFNLEKYIKKGRKKIGVIFNTDPHYKEGSHWVALFIDINKREIYYFDSYGERISKYINRFGKNVVKQGLKLNMKFILIAIDE